MKITEKTRLTCYELRDLFGRDFDPAAIQKLRNASKALYRFEELTCGTYYTANGESYESLIMYVDADGDRPHLFRAGPYHNGYKTLDLGRVRDARAAAQRVIVAYNASNDGPRARMSLYCPRCIILTSDDDGKNYRFI